MFVLILAWLAGITLWLELALHAVFWGTLSVLFIFVLSVPETWAVANYSWWAAFRVASMYATPFLMRLCEADVRKKVWVIIKRELRLLSGIILISREGDNSRMWTNIRNVLQQLRTPETRKEAREIYALVTKPEIKTEAWYKCVSCAIYAVLVTIFLQFNRLDGPWALPSSHWLCWVVYADGNYAWFRLAHMVLFCVSQFKVVQIAQLRALLRLQKWALNLLFRINIILESSLLLLWTVLGNSDRLVWIVRKCMASLIEQFFFDLIGFGLYIFWVRPNTWDSRGRNFYLTIKAWITVSSVIQARDSFPRHANNDTDWNGQESFEYPALKEKRGTIRLLVLHPRLPLGDIRCTLFEVLLSDAPPYEAISYTWGRKGNLRENIWVNGKALNVPKSSHTILSNRSSVWRPQLLWMDAVCINQKDDGEKTRQVPMMRAIYTKACIVSVCLETSRGPQGNLPLFHQINEAFLATGVVYELAHLDLKTFRNEGEVHRRFNGSARGLEWLAFQALVRNSWFTRVWVVQEVALASSIRVFYGRSEFSWDLLVSAITTCIHHPALASLLEVTGEIENSLTRLTPVQTPVTLDIMDDFHQRVKDNKISFTSALYESRGFGATDPKDHIFGLLGFYHKGENTESSLRKAYNYVRQQFTHIYARISGAAEADAKEILVPEKIAIAYRKSVTKVYKDAAQYLLEQENPLRLLSYAGLGFFTLEERQPQDEKEIPGSEKIPSWCPNWSQQPMARILSYTHRKTQDPHYRAGGIIGENPVCYSKDEYSTLIVWGRVLDTIVTLGEPLTAPSQRSASSDEADTPDKASKSPFTNTASSTPESPSTYKVEEVINCFKAASKSLDLLEATFKDTPYTHTTDSQPLKEVFWRTLIGNRTPTKYPAPISCEIGFDLWMAFGTIASLSGPLRADARMPLKELQALDIKETFGPLIPLCGLGRRMCVTEKGYVGMVPPLTVERDEKGETKGDVVFLVRGAEVPFVLRPVREEGKRLRYLLVGEAYIHGIMDGEMAKWDDEGFKEDAIEII